MNSEYSHTLPGEGGRDICIPRFHMHRLENAWLSKQKGSPVFDEVEYVEITTPSGSVVPSIVDRRVKEEDKQRWPEHYRRFKDGQEPPSEGMPVEEWAAISRSQADELRAAGVRTVEVLANLPDLQLQKCVPMGGHALRAKAQAFIAQAQGMAPMSELIARDETQKREIARLEAAIADLGAKYEERERHRREQADQGEVVNG